jgi:hypothetical protein
LPLEQNFPLLVIIGLGHHNYSSSYPCFWLFMFLKRNMCRVQRSFVFNKTLP